MLNVVSELGDRSRFLHAVVVSLVNDRTFGRDPEPFLQLLADLEDAVAVATIGSPDAEFVALGPNVDNSTANVIAVLLKGFSD